MVWTQAANLLNVSRPFFIGLLDQGKLPFHKTGTHRRIRFDRQERVMEALAAGAQKRDLGS